MIRQGDISLHKIEQLPAGVKEAKDNILAYGEITDHRHWLNSEKVCVFEDIHKNKFVKLEQDTQLIHSDSSLEPVFDKDIATKQDKHLTITVQKGFYAVKQEREFNIFDEEVRQVLD